MAIRRVLIISLFAFVLLVASAGNTGYVNAQDETGTSEITPNAFGDIWTGSNSTAGLTVQNNGTGAGLYGWANTTNTTKGAVYGYNGIGYALYGKGAYGIFGESTLGNHPGVYGFNKYTNGFGVRGATVGLGGIAVSGKALLNGTGVKGESSTGTGVYGTSADGTGVYGYSDDGHGVSGFSAGGGNAVNGNVNSSNYAAIEGINWGTGYGLEGWSGGTAIHGYGVTGVLGEAINGNGTGVVGVGTNQWGVEAQGNDASYNDDYGDILLSGYYGEIFAEGQVFDMYSNDEVIVDLDNDNNTSNSCFSIMNGTNITVWSACESGGVISTGTQASVVDTASEGQRLMYAVEGTGVWLEDVGTASLVDGKMTIAFGNVYAQAANMAVEYQVFVTATCDQPVLLYVSEKNSTGFTVKGTNLDGSASSCSFDYRVVAQRAGYENVKSEQYTQDVDLAKP